MKFRMRDGTGIVDLKFLVADYDRHGNVRVYVRRHGRKTRIRETPGTDEFMIAYRAALAACIAPMVKSHEAAKASTLRWLVEHYYRSAEYRRLADSTKRVKRGILDKLCEEHGAMPFVPLESRHVRMLRDKKAEFPEAANSIVKALRQVFKYAVETGKADCNPARDVPLFPPSAEGFHTWSIEEVWQFEARHPIGTKARLAMALLLYTGVRRSDVVRLGPQMERRTQDGEFLCFREMKGQDKQIKDREIPILPELRIVLDAFASNHLNYITTEFGKPFTPPGFGNWFRRRCNEAGLTNCSAHGLRKAGATIAADNGATEHQLMAMYGWDSPKQAAIYTRKANRKRLAAEAMHKVVPAKSVPLSNAVASGGTIRGKKP
jgi:integrase